MSGLVERYSLHSASLSQSFHWCIQVTRPMSSAFVGKQRVCHKCTLTLNYITNSIKQTLSKVTFLGHFTQVYKWSVFRVMWGKVDSFETVRGRWFSCFAHHSERPNGRGWDSAIPWESGVALKHYLPAESVSIQYMSQRLLACSSDLLS